MTPNEDQTATKLLKSIERRVPQLHEDRNEQASVYFMVATRLISRGLSFLEDSEETSQARVKILSNICRIAREIEVVYRYQDITEPKEN